MTPATQIRLRDRPVGLPRDHVWEKTQDSPRELQDGDISVDVQYLSVDPAMRGWLNDVRSYVPPVGIGDVMRAGSVGVETSEHALNRPAMHSRMQEGKLHLDEHIVEGIDSFPEALRMLFDGRNTGKLVLKVH